MPIILHSRYTHFNNGPEKKKSPFPHLSINHHQPYPPANAKKPYPYLQMKNTSGQRIHGIEERSTQRNSSRRHRPRQHTDIIHKALYQILVLVLWVTGCCEVALASDFGGGDFDFEFVFEVVLRWWLLTWLEG